MKVIVYYSEWAEPSKRQLRSVKKVKEKFGSSISLETVDVEENSDRANEENIPCIPVTQFKDTEFGFIEEEFLQFIPEEKIEQTLRKHGVTPEINQGKKEADEKSQRENKESTIDKSDNNTRKLEDKIDELRQRAGLDNPPEPDFE